MAKSLEKYIELFHDWLPTGDAWRRDPETNIRKLFKGFSHEYFRAECRQLELITREVNPCTTQELLEDWERLVGIPDECTGSFQTTEDRRNQIKQKLTSRGGLNEAFYIEIAASFGVDTEIEIDNAQACRAGACRAGDRIYSQAWQFFWIVETSDFIRRFCRAGSCRAGDRLSEFGNETLECTIKKLKPAHTDVIFRFGT